MPYITQKERRKFYHGLTFLNPQKPGDLNFVITSICHEYLTRMGKDYIHLNEIVGVLECAKQEFYRKIAVPYEEAKEEENGPVK